MLVSKTLHSPKVEFANREVGWGGATLRTQTEPAVCLGCATAAVPELRLMDSVHRQTSFDQKGANRLIS